MQLDIPETVAPTQATFFASLFWTAQSGRGGGDLAMSVWLIIFAIYRRPGIP